MVIFIGCKCIKKKDAIQLQYSEVGTGAHTAVNNWLSYVRIYYAIKFQYLQ